MSSERAARLEADIVFFVEAVTRVEALRSAFGVVGSSGERVIAGGCHVLLDVAGPGERERVKADVGACGKLSNLCSVATSCAPSCRTAWVGSRESSIGGFARTDEVAGAAAARVVEGDAWTMGDRR